MEKKKYFAIVEGKKTGVIYDSWSNVKDYVLKVRGADYKSFDTRDEAEAYMNHSKISKDKVNDSVDTEIAELGDKELIAFTDGSYKEGIDRYGSGAIIISNIGGKTNFNKICNYGTKKEYLSMRNVAGEILAVIDVVKWALERNYKSVHIYYDLKEIQRWADRLDNRNNELTRELSDFVNESREVINIQFTKISSHTGVKYNELADKEAKKALE